MDSWGCKLYYNYNEKQVNGKVSNIDKHFIKSDHDEEEGESWGQEQLIF